MLDRSILALLALTGLVVTGVAVAPASAVEAGSLDDVFTVDEPADSIRNALTAIGAVQERSLFWIRNQMPDFLADNFESLRPPEHTASDELNDLAEYYNENNGTLEAYANDRATFTENKTVKITLELRDSSASRYLNWTVDGDGNITESSIDGSTNQDVTDTITACGYSADQATEELRYFTEEFAEPNNDVTREYLSELAGKYGGTVETTLVSWTDGDCD